jgi:hypothetical protein
MTMVRGYDGEPTVKVEIDTDVEIYGGLTANVTASCHIERIRYCMFCGKKIVND